MSSLIRVSPFSQSKKFISEKFQFCVSKLSYLVSSSVLTTYLQYASYHHLNFFLTLWSFSCLFINGFSLKTEESLLHLNHFIQCSKGFHRVSGESWLWVCNAHVLVSPPRSDYVTTVIPLRYSMHGSPYQFSRAAIKKHHRLSGLK